MKATLEFRKHPDDPIAIKIVLEGIPTETTALIQLIRSFAIEKKWVEQ